MLIFTADQSTFETVSNWFNNARFLARAAIHLHSLVAYRQVITSTSPHATLCQPNLPTRQESKMQIVIAPASTKTGAAAVRALLSAQNSSLRVKALYRDLHKVPDEFRHREDFTAVQADVSDASSLEFSGADAVLAITPPVFDGRDPVGHSQLVSNNVRDAIEKAGCVKRLVLLSSVGAEFAEGVVCEMLISTFVEETDVAPG